MFSFISKAPQSGEPATALALNVSAWELQEALWRLRSSADHPGSFKYKENEEFVMFFIE